MTRQQLSPPERRLPVTSFVVALDGSLFSERAIDPAVRLADGLGLPLRLWSAASTPDEAAMRRMRLRHLAEAIDADWELVLSEQPAEDLMPTAGDDDDRHPLVCLATHGRDRSAVVVHSTAALLLAESEDPVLLIGPAVSDFPPSRTVVACVDGSDDSEAVMAAATRWAGALGIGVTAVTVAEPVPESVRRPGYYPRRHGPQSDADAYIAALVAAWTDDVPVTGRVIYDPVSVDRPLLQSIVAEQAGLVVMGTRSPHGLRRLVLGSTAAEVTHGSPAPVLVVPV